MRCLDLPSLDVHWGALDSLGCQHKLYLWKCPFHQKMSELWEITRAFLSLLIVFKECQCKDRTRPTLGEPKGWCWLRCWFLLLTAFPVVVTGSHHCMTKVLCITQPRFCYLIKNTGPFFCHLMDLDVGSNNLRYFLNKLFYLMFW